MKNLLSREEFLKSDLNEGRFGDTIRKGFNKVKSFFSLMIKKVKNFIAIFDKNGDVLPVIPLQAVIDHFSNSGSVKIFSSKEMSDSVIKAGGKGCKTSVSTVGNMDSYDDPTEIEKKNFETFMEIMNGGGGEKIEERMSYSKPGAKLNIATIDTEELKEMLEDAILEKQGVYENAVYGNILIFGAPGIGKSTIPNAIINAYNKGKSAKDSLSLITIDCPNIAPGDFLMPTIPTEKDVANYVKNNTDEIADFSVIKDMTDREKAELEHAFGQQLTSDSAPKAWLPCYKKTGNPKIDKILDAAANGYASEEDGGEYTGSGGIIMFDELFRADPTIFKQLMVFLLNRGFSGGWKLGSKWAIIACSNRPVDDRDIETRFTEADSAFMDRFTDIALLKPSEDSWKEYMRGLGLEGDNEILFRFIFDPDSKDGDEFPRWHGADACFDKEQDDSQGNEKSEARTVPVTPRRWEKVWRRLKEFMNRKGYDSILSVPAKTLEKWLKTTFTPDFLSEMINWIETHTGNVSLDNILVDPASVFPRKDGRSEDVIVIRDLWEQTEKKYKSKGDIPDDDLAKVIIWLGMHMKDQGNLVQIEYFNNLDKIAPNGEENNLFTKTESVNALFAAWPSKDDFENPKMGIDKKRLNNIKKLMKKYFPWRIKGDDIIWVDEYAD